MEQFHPKELEMGTSTRESWRYQFGEHSSEKLDTARDILTDALKRHGAEAVTKENYHKVMEYARKDDRWHHLQDTGVAALESHLKSRFGIQDHH